MSRAFTVLLSFLSRIVRLQATNTLALEKWSCLLPQLSAFNGKMDVIVVQLFLL